MNPKIVKPPKHLRAHTQWWVSTARGDFGGGADPKTGRADAFRIRDRYREAGEAATVYRVEVSFKAKRVERAK